MTKIGKFKREGSGFRGSIVTLSVQAKDVLIVPLDAEVSEGAPSHSIKIGSAEIGLGWADGHYDGALRLELDDPSFANPISARLKRVGEGDHFELVWNRP